MKKRNLAIVMAMAMAMTTFGGVTVFAADKKTEEKTETTAEGNTYNNEQPILDCYDGRYQR